METDKNQRKLQEVLQCGLVAIISRCHFYYCCLLPRPCGQPQHAVLAWLMLPLLLIVAAQAQEENLSPLPPAVAAIINAPDAPSVRLSPSGDYLFLAERERYQSLAELQRRKVKLAGLRVEPDTYSRHGQLYWNNLKIKKITLAECCDHPAQEVPLPPNAQITLPIISANSKRFAFLLKKNNGLELWAGETATARARPIANLRVNTLFDTFEDEDPGEESETEFFNLPLQWLPDQVHILVKGVVAPTVTMPDEFAGDKTLLTSHSEKLNRIITPDALQTNADARAFESYALSQPVLAHAVTGEVKAIGPPAIWESLTPSPDGQYFLARRLLRPYLTGVAHNNFAVASEVWDTQGCLVKQMRRRGPLQEVSTTGIRSGPRAFNWRETAPATLTWAEAHDSENKKRPNAPQDYIFMQAAPFTAPAKQIATLEARFSDLKWGEKDGLAFLYDDAGRVSSFYPDHAQPKLVELWQEPCNNDTCQIVTRQEPDGTTQVVQYGTAIYLTGTTVTNYQSCSYLARFDLTTRRQDILFKGNGKNESQNAHPDNSPTPSKNDARRPLKNDGPPLESFQRLLTPDARYILTRRESPVEPPNYYVRALGQGSHAGNALRPVTEFPDLVPTLRQVRRQFVSYQRRDGVNLSFVLYLPPNYQPGTRLPTVISVYPRDYDDGVRPDLDADPVYKYLDLTGVTPLFFTLRGYAVLEQVTMPVIGPDANRNDSFIEQTTWNTQAAIDKAVKLGVADPERIGVIGHSYGAFAAANLLAHTDLFRAGIASSGAYNRTLTPYGFQHETRTLWQAREFYTRISPFSFANQIKEPLLLIHGEEDENGGTSPFQSKEMAAAIRTNGGTTELIFVPYEGHQYKARESVAQALAAMFEWFDKYVKNAPPRAKNIKEK